MSELQLQVEIPPRELDVDCELVVLNNARRIRELVIVLTLILGVSAVVSPQIEEFHRTLPQSVLEGCKMHVNRGSIDTFQ
jgi:hypothetical protein